jgi:hypothetical protein
LFCDFTGTPATSFDIRPDKNLTGGSVRTTQRDAACGHAREYRVPLHAALRDEILRRYGLPAGEHPDYEIDHLIPLCLGGSDDSSNLWPQPRRNVEPTWNAEAKDRLERRMCDVVCGGEIDITTAQQALRLIGWLRIRSTTEGANAGASRRRLRNRRVARSVGHRTPHWGNQSPRQSIERVIASAPRTAQDHALAGHADNPAAAQSRPNGRGYLGGSHR